MAARHLRVAMVAPLALVGGAPGLAWAGGGAETNPYEDVGGSASLGVAALLDGYLADNLNAPVTGRNGLREFDTRANRPALGYLRVTLAHAPELLGFRLDAGVGDTSQAFLSEDPARTTHPRESMAFSHVQQAFVSLRLPWPGGLELDAGKFDTPVGLEDNVTTTSWNYSRSLIFSWAEPTLHSGLRATFEPWHTLGVSLFWINGWNANVQDGNGMRSFSAAATWTPTPSWEVALVYMGGLERAPTALANPQLTFRNLADGYVIYSPPSFWSLAATSDYGVDRAHGGVTFWGATGYVRARLTNALSTTLRAEYFDDPNGFATGIAQRVVAGTATFEARTVVRSVAFAERIELRHDVSSAPAFDVGARPLSGRQQDTLTVALLASF
jgi:hypothetical protein